MRSGFFLLLVVLCLAALAALLWWRFRGSGQPATPALLQATRNHRSLRPRHYEPASTAPAATEAPVSENALNRLLPPEDVDAPESSAAEEQDSELVAACHPEPAAAPDASSEEPPRPVSIRHAAGAVASLLDALDETPASVAPAAEPEAGPGPEPDEEPAEALFHNPLTAPAPTANDQANRAAEIALRQQRRARMSAGAAAQRTALTGLFPGAGSPVPAAKPS